MEKLLRNVKHAALKLFLRLKGYIKHLLFPIYLSPMTSSAS